MFPRRVPCPYPQAEAVWNLREVAPGLYVGGFYAVTRGGWHTIIDLDGGLADDPGYAGFPVVHHFPLRDGEPFPLGVLRKVQSAVDIARGDVLIHCAAGVSRSMSAAYYILRRRGFMHALAAARVKSLDGRRPLDQPFQSAREEADARC